MSPYLTISRNLWWNNSSPDLFFLFFFFFFGESLDLLKLKKKKNQWHKSSLPNLLKLGEKKYIWWRNIPSQKIRFSDENIRWRKTFITYHVLLVMKKFHHQYILWRSLSDECYFVSISSPYVFGDEIRTYCDERFRHHSPLLL